MENRLSSIKKVIKEEKVVATRVNDMGTEIEGKQHTLYHSSQNKPQVLVQASAIGYYGPSDDQVIEENSPPGDDYMARLCQEWENSSAQVVELRGSQGGHPWEYCPQL